LPNIYADNVIKKSKHPVFSKIIIHTKPDKKEEKVCCRPPHH